MKTHVISSLLHNSLIFLPETASNHANYNTTKHISMKNYFIINKETEKKTSKYSFLIMFNFPLYLLTEFKGSNSHHKHMVGTCKYNKNSSTTFFDPFRYFFNTISNTFACKRHTHLLFTHIFYLLLCIACVL